MPPDPPATGREEARRLVDALDALQELAGNLGRMDEYETIIQEAREDIVRKNEEIGRLRCIYESAVQGRQDFRRAFKELREKMSLTIVSDKLDSDEMLDKMLAIIAERDVPQGQVEELKGWYDEAIREANESGYGPCTAADAIKWSRIEVDELRGKLDKQEHAITDLRTALEGALRQKTEAEERGEQLALEMGKRERELTHEAIALQAKVERQRMEKIKDVADLRTQLDAVTQELAEVNAFRAEPFKAFRNILGDEECDDEAVAGSVVAVLLVHKETGRLLREARADLLALQVEYGRVRDAAEKVLRKMDETAGQFGWADVPPECERLDTLLSSPSPAAEVGEKLRAIAEAIEDEWCYGKPDEKHARGDCTACNLASALRTLGLGPKE